MHRRRRVVFRISDDVWCKAPGHHYFCTPHNGARGKRPMENPFGRNDCFAKRNRSTKGFAKILKTEGAITRHPRPSLPLQRLRTIYSITCLIRRERRPNLTRSHEPLADLATVICTWIFIKNMRKRRIPAFCTILAALRAAH